nr:HGGxSTG domain-containing protein [Paraburkholderia caribensis]
MVGPYWPRPLPKRLRGLTCGAKLRGGARCTRTDISKRNGRCHAHGGASTGPRTPAGKARCAANSGLPKMWAELRASDRSTGISSSASSPQ